MKKLLSILLVLVMSFGIFAVTASADAVTLVDPVQGNIRFSDTTMTETLEGDIVTGRTYTIGAYANKYMKYQVPSGTSVDKWRNNFIWEFDFKFNSIVGARGIEIGIVGTAGYNQSDASSKYVWLKAFSGTEKIYVSNGYRYLTGSDSAGTGSHWSGDAAKEKYIEIGKFYHLKLEADLSAGALTVTFSDPYTETDPMLTRTYTIENAFTPVGNSVAEYSSDTMTADNCRLFIRGLRNTSDGPIEFVTKNETFTMERFKAFAPEITADVNNVTATATLASTLTDNTLVVPNLITALYDKTTGELIDYSIQTKHPDTTDEVTAAFEPFTPVSYSATLENIPDGEYTVKAFIWNTVDGMVPYEDCLVEKDITVTDGVASIITE